MSPLASKILKYRTRAINHRGYYSKNIFWAVGRGYNSRAATIQKIFFLGTSYRFNSHKATKS